ncbi:hypothetical protein EDB80DRAFT_842900 [Ilyonectria destructans]|nr:hypothetical protein EDB80DRAFT_842900 [Ilyonectria destructans]
MQKIERNDEAIHTALWNTPGCHTRCRLSENAEKIHSQRCCTSHHLWTRDSSLQCWCILHDRANQSEHTPEKQSCLLDTGISFNRIQNTPFRRRDTWTDFSGALYTDGNGCCISSTTLTGLESLERKLSSVPPRKFSETTQHNLKTELIDHFWTTDDERLYLSKLLFSGGADRGIFNEQEKGTNNNLDQVNEGVTEKEHRELENWIWDLYNQMPCPS